MFSGSRSGVPSRSVGPATNAVARDVVWDESRSHQGVLRTLGVGREADAMTAPRPSIPAARRPAGDSGHLRLRMAEDRSPAGLDGVWWPRSRDIVTEVADLVDHFPADRFGRVVRVLVSPADWDVRPRHALVRGGIIRLGYLPADDDSHLVHVTTSERNLLPLLVIPSSFTRQQGNAALAAAADHADRRSAGALVERLRRGSRA